MTVSLGGIVLDDNLRLNGDISGSQIAMSIRRTFGAPVIQKVTVSAGKKLVLMATMSGESIDGSYTRLQLEQLAVHRDTGFPISLIHHLGSFNVIIPPDGIQEEIMQDYANPGPDDLYTGTVTMITV